MMEMITILITIVIACFLAKQGDSNCFIVIYLGAILTILKGRK